MLQLFESGGVLMWPLLACSIFALAIILEKLWILRRARILPSGVSNDAIKLSQSQTITEEALTHLRQQSALGFILAACMNTDMERELSAETSGRQVIMSLEQRLNLLGTIAAITPLIGLLGTVIGMIKVFADLMQGGMKNPELLAGGISEALITTAAGLSIAIPCLVAYRLFQRRIEVYAQLLQQQTQQFLSAIQ